MSISSGDTLNKSVRLETGLRQEVASEEQKNRGNAFSTVRFVEN